MPGITHGFSHRANRKTVVNSEKKPKAFPANRTHSGFALPLALGMGLVLFSIGLTTVMVAQSDRNNSLQRRETDSSYVVAEGGVARVLAQLRLPNNAVLLTRNYDPNTNNNKNYLGPDGTANTGDETATNINEWASYTAPSTSNCGGTALAAPSITYSASIGATGQYTLKAYRYNSTQKTGTFLVEGVKGTSKSYIAVTLTIIPVSDEFPGIAVTETAYIQGRTVSGSNANIYFNPSSYHPGYPGLTGSAASGDASRPQYLNALWTGSSDGFSGDPVSGKIIACAIAFTLPDAVQGTSAGNIKTSTTLSGNIGGITHRYTNELMLDGTETLTVNTTLGPVYLYVTNKFSLEGSSKILNVRSDAQPPRVGDLRIIGTGGSGHEFLLKGTPCIQGAFLYNSGSDLQLQATGGGCPSGANIEGVVWAEDFLSSKTKTTARVDSDTTEGDSDNSATYGATSGLVVPEDVSSLSDILPSLGIVPQYRFGQIKNWQRARF